MGTIAAKAPVPKVLESRQMNAFVRAFLTDTQGTTAIEYALIASLIAVAIVGTLAVLSGTVTGMYGIIAGSM